MTLREIGNALEFNVKLYITTALGRVEFNFSEPVMMDAMGDCEVEKLFPISETEMEITLKMQPVRRSRQ